MSVDTLYTAHLSDDNLSSIKILRRLIQPNYKRFWSWLFLILPPILKSALQCIFIISHSMIVVTSTTIITFYHLVLIRAIHHLCYVYFFHTNPYVFKPYILIGSGFCRFGPLSTMPRLPPIPPRDFLKNRSCEQVFVDLKENVL